VATAAGAAGSSSGQQQQQQKQFPPQQQQQQQPQCIDEYLSHERVVRVACAASRDMLLGLNSMRAIAINCMTAPPQQQADRQQQQQEQEHDREQLVQQFVDAEDTVASYCARSCKPSQKAAALAALDSMSVIVLGALTQGG
jgi:hypothetical protein